MSSKQIDVEKLMLRTNFRGPGSRNLGGVAARGLTQTIFSSRKELYHVSG